MNRDALAPETIEPFVRLALDCVRRPYPYHLVHVVHSDADARPPRELTPAFYGCFDWHSAVHGHWTLARAIRLFPGAPWADEARDVLQRNLTEPNLKTEADYFRSPGREGFERPYGLAWLLQLAGELREFDDPDARDWATWLAPLERIVVERFSAWLPKLTHPIRSGEHGQTAFAMGLAVDFARKWDRDGAFIDLLVRRGGELYLRDVEAPLHYEPSGHDFLSPTLAEADLVRRILRHDVYRAWLYAFLPQVPLDGSTDWLRPATSPDRADGKLSHLDGLSLSRAWMLQGIAQALPEEDPRRPALLASAEAHARAGLEAIEAAHYAGAHWLGSFAVYLLTRRGVAG